MPKERTINPAQAARKAEKQKALKKSKAEKLTRNTEKLARRNPERLQRQIDDLKALEQTSGSLRPKDKATLEQLEKDVAAVRKARGALGDKAPVFGRERGGGGSEGARRGERGDRGEGSLGKRRRGERDAYGGWKENDNNEESETDEEVRAIPMPRDTPPPVPRRERRPTGREDGGRQQQQPSQVPPRPVVPSKTVYSSAPVLRDLVGESKRFVPASVAQNLARTKGEGGRLLEPDEMDKLEKAGYGDAAAAAEEATKEAAYNMMNAEVETRGQDLGVEGEARRFERELKQVEMEEVEDEDL